MQALDPEMDSFDKLMTLCFSVHDLIESDIPVGLLASLYSSQVVTKGDKHLLNQNRFYYKMVNQLVDEGQRRGQITRSMPYYEIAHMYSARGQSSMITAFQTVAMHLESIQERQCLCCSAECV